MILTFVLVSIGLVHFSNCFLTVVESNMRFRRSLNKLSDLMRTDDNMEVSTSSSNTKEMILKNAALLVSCVSSSVLLRATSVSAEVVADDLIRNSNVVEKTFDPMAASQFASEVERNRALNSDEFIVKFENNSLGLGLTETFYKGFPVTTVSSIRYPLNNPNDPEFRVSNYLLSSFKNIFILFTLITMISLQSNTASK